MTATSKMEDALQVTKSVDTTSWSKRIPELAAQCSQGASSVQSRTPFMGPLEASLIAATMSSGWHYSHDWPRLTSVVQSSYLAGFSKRTVRSTTETFGVGTRKAIPCCAVHDKVLPSTEM